MMNESLGKLAFVVGFVALWFVLNRWVLPRLGVKT
jgi:hypothetical protein